MPAQLHRGARGCKAQAVALAGLRAGDDAIALDAEHEDARPEQDHDDGEHDRETRAAANDDRYPARRLTANLEPASTLYEEFHPFGTTSYAANDSGIEVSAKRYRYIGKERDEETGLYHLGARYYASWLGRWTAADPIGLGDGVNRYAYARGSPSRLSDPRGTKANAPDEPSVRVDADPGQVVEFSDGKMSVRALNQSEIESGRESVRRENEKLRRSIEATLVPTAKGKAKAAAAKAEATAASVEAEADAEAKTLYNDPHRDLKLGAARQGLGVATATLRLAVGILSLGTVGFDDFKDGEAREAEKETAASALVQFGSAAVPVVGKLRAGHAGGAAATKPAKASSSETATQPVAPAAEGSGGPSTIYHYTDAAAGESISATGLYRGSSATPTRYTHASDAGDRLGVPTPEVRVEIVARGQFRRVGDVQASHRYSGGGQDWVADLGVAVEDIIRVINMENP